MYKKNIVLSGVNNPSRRAVLSLECDGYMAKGKLRLYNFDSEPQGIISLGIYQNGSVVKAGLIRTSQMLYTFACQMENMSDDFSCAVINFVNGEPSPILFGNGVGHLDSDQIFSQVIEELKDKKEMSQVEETLDYYGIDYDDKLKEEIEEKIDECVSKNDCLDCESCKYKQYYLDNCKSESLAVSQSEEEGEEKQFYVDLKPQIDKLFEENPSEEYLEKLIPNSKWVKVNIDDHDNYYVLGLIYDGEQLQYICYGVPGVYQKIAPRELAGYPVWFPLEEDKPQGFGYWLSYQDAESGESVKAIVV